MGFERGFGLQGFKFEVFGLDIDTQNPKPKNRRGCGRRRSPTAASAKRRRSRGASPAAPEPRLCILLGLIEGLRFTKVVFELGLAQRV